MDNAFVASLVVYALNTAKSMDQIDFQKRVLELLKDIKMATGWDEIDWFNEAEERLKSEYDFGELINMSAAFNDMVHSSMPEDLLPMMTGVRLCVLMESAGEPVHEIENIYSTFTIRWKDGKQVEYTCRPYSEKTIKFDVKFIAGMTHMLTDQFVESTIRPGLDSFHDKAAKTFEPDKFEDLMTVLDDYIEGVAEDKREGYKATVTRIRHQFGIIRNTSDQIDEPFIEFIKGPGGFK